jgi:hypothetical protein
MLDTKEVPSLVDFLNEKPLEKERAIRLFWLSVKKEPAEIRKWKARALQAELQKSSDPILRRGS